MSVGPDPYRDWLNLSVTGRKPTHYELLGLPAFETDAQRIGDAFHQRYAEVRKYEVGTHSEQAQRLLEEISDAFACLTKDDVKHDYDEALRKTIAQRTTLTDVPATETLSDTQDESDRSAATPTPGESATGTVPPPMGLKFHERVATSDEQSDAAEPSGRIQPPPIPSGKRGSPGPPATEEQPPPRPKRARNRKPARRARRRAILAAMTVSIVTAAAVFGYLKLVSSTDSPPDTAGEVVVSPQQPDPQPANPEPPTPEDTLPAVADIDDLAELIESYSTQLAEWEQAFHTRTADILARPKYGSSIELTAILEKEQADHLKSTADLRNLLQKIGAGFVTVAKDQETQAREVAGDPELLREVVQQRLHLAALKTQADSLERPEVCLARASGEVHAELELLRQLEKLSALEPVRIFGRTLDRAKDYLDSENTKLRMMGLWAVVGSAGEDELDHIVQDVEFADFSEADRAKLCWWLYKSGRQCGIQTAVDQISEEPALVMLLNANQLLAAVEQSPDVWQPAVPVLAKHFVDPIAARRIFQVQCRLKDDAWVDAIRQSCKGGPLQGSPKEVVDAILAARWIAAYPVVRDILRSNPALEIARPTLFRLDELVREDPQTAAAVALRLLADGDPRHFTWALDLYVDGDAMPEADLKAAIERMPSAYHTSSLNQLLRYDVDKTLDVAEWLLDRSDGINPNEINIRSFGAKTLGRDTLAAALRDKLWLATDNARKAWVLDQELGTALRDELLAVHARQREQNVVANRLVRVLQGGRWIDGAFRILAQDREGIEFGDLTSWPEQQAEAQGLLERLGKLKLAPAARRDNILQRMQTYLELVEQQDDHYYQSIRLSRKTFSKPRPVSRVFGYHMNRSDRDDYFKHLDAYGKLEVQLRQARASVPWLAGR